MDNFKMSLYVSSLFELCYIDVSIPAALITVGFCYISQWFEYVSTHFGSLWYCMDNFNSSY